MQHLAWAARFALPYPPFFGLENKGSGQKGKGKVGEEKFHRAKKKDKTISFLYVSILVIFSLFYFMACP